MSYEQTRDQLGTRGPTRFAAQHPAEECSHDNPDIAAPHRYRVRANDNLEMGEHAVEVHERGNGEQRCRNPCERFRTVHRSLPRMAAFKNIASRAVAPAEQL